MFPVAIVGIASITITGCAIPSMSSAAAASIGLPIEPKEQALRRSEITEPGAVAWSESRRYWLTEDVLVIPYPPHFECSTEYVVNAKGIIVGFNLAGAGCRYLSYPKPR